MGASWTYWAAEGVWLVQVALPPCMVRFTTTTGSQLAFPSPSLMSLADPGQMPLGDWSVTGNGGREQKRERREQRKRGRQREMKSRKVREERERV